MHGSDIVLFIFDDDETVAPSAVITDNGSSIGVTPGGDLTITDAGSYLTFTDPTSALPNVSDAGTYLTITN